MAFRLNFFLAVLSIALQAAGYAYDGHFTLAAKSAVPAALKAGQTFETDVLAMQNLAKNTGVWRPTAAQIDSAAFKVIVGELIPPPRPVLREATLAVRSLSPSARSCSVATNLSAFAAN